MAVVHLGDCRDVLATIADNSIDSIVTDPPYELGFMGKAWDNTGIAYDVTVWQQCLRVLKPGGHLIAFGGSRTYHRMAVAIEDAGFEIRDQIQWIYGSGFPKSLAVDKAIDKQRHDREQVYAVTAWMRQARDNAGLSNRDIANVFGFTPQMADHWTTQKTQPSVPTLDQIPPLLDLFGLTLDDVPDDVRTLIWTLNGRKGQPGEAWYQRTVVTEKREDMFGEYEVEEIKEAGMGSGKTFGMLQSEGENHKANHKIAITTPATDLAKQWQGWGTALKPAHEPAVLARKPLTGTVADNVTAWGVGALNVDGCRIGTEGGRWPANVIFNEEAAQILDAQSGHSVSEFGGKSGTHFSAGNQGIPTPDRPRHGHSDSGGASRFFYVAKASKAEREAGLDAPAGQRANIHTTVKPIALMRYLVRMVTPKGGIVLDPFTGSGSTGCAAVLEGCDFVGMDITPEYVEIAQKRIAYYAVESPLL